MALSLHGLKFIDVVAKDILFLAIYVLVRATILALMVKNNSYIRCHSINNEYLLMTQYADDTEFLLLGSKIYVKEESIKIICQYVWPKCKL